MATSKEKIDNIEKQIEQLKERKKAITQAEKAKLRKSRNHKLIQVGAKIEKVVWGEKGVNSFNDKNMPDNELNRFFNIVTQGLYIIDSFQSLFDEKNLGYFSEEDFNSIIDYLRKADNSRGDFFINHINKARNS